MLKRPVVQQQVKPRLQLPHTHIGIIDRSHGDAMPLQEKQGSECSRDAPRLSNANCADMRCNGGVLFTAFVYSKAVPMTLIALYDGKLAGSCRICADDFDGKR